MEPTKGFLTFRAEGNNSENSRYFSRVIHWPGLTAQCHKYGSGVTIGRGYDLKHRSSGDIIRDLTYAGVPLAQAEKIAKAAKLSHCKAAEFVKERKSESGKITEQQQLRLFEYIYDKYISDAKRFYNRYKNQNQLTGKN